MILFCVFLYLLGVVVGWVITHNQYKDIIQTQEELIKLHEEKEVNYKNMIANDEEFLEKQSDYIKRLETNIAELEGR